MRILMLGWEFPPHIAGGVGTACEGLTRALDRQGHEVVFVLPRPFEPDKAGPVAPGPAPEGARAARSPAGTGPQGAGDAGPPRGGAGPFAHVTFRSVPAGITDPYSGGRITLRGASEAGVGAQDASPGAAGGGPEIVDPLLSGRAVHALGREPDAPADPYATPDLIAETERYMRLVVSLVRHERFDAVHAHDWPTFCAGGAVAKVHRRPFIAHVHSTEFDRAGTTINQRVHDAEKAGLLAADRVIAVSRLTKSVIVRRYGIDPAKVDVVYNGIDPPERAPAPARDGQDRYVLFLGRITAQKGPEYFLAAAKRVLDRLPHVKFVLAGSGDMTLKMIELAAGMGIGDRVLFTGFLRGAEVDRVFGVADCFVMPSVSEPFGIAALEAAAHDVPVIVSTSSGVSEVMRHVLKADFWDTEELANKIIAVLTHPPLARTLRAHASYEVHRLSWDEAAKACVEVYQRAAAPAG